MLERGGVGEETFSCDINVFDVIQEEDSWLRGRHTILMTRFNLNDLIKIKIKRITRKRKNNNNV